MLQQVTLFLISTLSSLYISAILLRFLLATNRADFYNPISQFLVKITQPVLAPLRRFIPAFGKIDTASLVLAFVLEFIASIIILQLSGRPVRLDYAFLATIADLTRMVIWIYIIALIAQAILSWVGNTYNNSFASLLDSLTAPILRPLRNVIPTIGMVDLSPLVAILLLQVILIVLGDLPSVRY